jgi:hypothetical protein
MFKKIVLGLVLAVFCLIPMSASADNINPVVMTYEGLVSPLDAINNDIYKPAKLVINSGGYIVWSKAVNVRQPTYIAVFVFRNKAIVITYYHNKKFYQVALPSNDATHLSMVKIGDAKIQRFQRDFTNIFGVPFPLASN